MEQEQTTNTSAGNGTPAQAGAAAPAPSNSQAGAKGPDKRVILTVMGAMALGIAAIMGFYAWNGARFVTTENARVSGDVVNISPQIAGKVLSWTVAEGDQVTAGQVLGRQDLELSMSSTAMNPAALGNVAGVLAGKAVITSPINGMVLKSTAIIGETAAPGKALAVIADTSHLSIAANIKETDIARVKVGQTVDVRIDAVPDTVFAGQVESIGRATASTFSLLGSQNDSANFTKVIQVVPLTIRLEQSDDPRLMIGMNAAISIHIE